MERYATRRLCGQRFLRRYWIDLFLAR